MKRWAIKLLHWFLHPLDLRKDRKYINLVCAVDWNNSGKKVLCLVVTFSYFFLIKILNKEEISKENSIDISSRYVHVILIEIDALFRQLSQNMSTDCSPDCATFYTNLHKLFCHQFISSKNWVNSVKFMDNSWTITCQVMAYMKKSLHWCHYY